MSSLMCLFCVLAVTCQDARHPSLSPIRARQAPSPMSAGGQSTVLTENGSHIEGCAIRLHCASLVSLIEYRSSFSCVEGAITKSLQAIGEI